MTKEFRRVLFWIFFLIFAPASIVIALYAQGYRFDFERRVLVKTGGIFIKTSVPEAQIYINDRLAKKTSGILSYSALIENLKPKNYEVLIYKEGFFPWNKSLVIDAGVVTEASEIILFPVNPPKFQIATTENLTPQQLIPTSFGNYMGQVLPSQFLLFDKEGGLISKFPIPKNSHDFFWLDTDHPGLFFLNSGEITFLDPQNKELKSVAKNILKIFAQDYQLWWLDEKGEIFKFNPAASLRQEAAKINYPKKVKTFYASSKEALAIVTTDGKLMLFDPTALEFKQIAFDVKETGFSPDGEKLLFIQKNQLWVYYLNKTLSKPTKEKGAKELIIESDESIQASFWLKDSEHIAVFTGSDLIITERDSRAKSNSVRFLQGIDEPIVYNPSANDIYFIQKGKLYRTNLLEK